MDWMIAIGAMLAGWMILSVLTGERLMRQKQIADAIQTAKQAAMEQAKAVVAKH